MQYFFSKLKQNIRSHPIKSEMCVYQHIYMQISLRKKLQKLFKLPIEQWPLPCFSELEHD